MTSDEKKHFILQFLALDNFNGKSINTSQLVSCINPSMEISEVNVLCREMEQEVPLNIFVHKDVGNTFEILQTTTLIDAFKTHKYLYLNSIDDIEFELLSYLYNKSSISKTRINHILVRSVFSVLETTEKLKNLVEDELITLDPPALELRYDKNRKLISDKVNAFENPYRAIKANITNKGKDFYMRRYLEEKKTTYQFNAPTNFIQGDNHGKQSLLVASDEERNEDTVLLIKIWNLISKNPLISGLLMALIIFVASIFWSFITNQNKQKSIINLKDTIEQVKK